MSQLISVVLPAHNESEALPTTIPEILAALKGEAAELIVVDDGSEDGTWDCVRALNARDTRVRGVRLTRNFGHQAALLAGLEVARGDAVITMDSDGQHPPELLPPMLARWRAGAEVVQAVRADRDARPGLRGFASRIFYRTMRGLSGLEIVPGSADFRLLSSNAVAAIRAVRGPAPLLRVLLPWLGLPTVHLPYRVRPRIGGRTSYTWPRMVALSLEGFVAYSTGPLRLVGLLGIIMALVSFVYLAYVLGVRFTSGAVVPGWASVAGLVALVGGVQLIVLAALGEYLARVFTSSIGRPPYVVRSRVGDVE